jgi:hypothetical protein
VGTTNYGSHFVSNAASLRVQITNNNQQITTNIIPQLIKLMKFGQTKFNSQSARDSKKNLVNILLSQV